MNALSEYRWMIEQDRSAPNVGDVIYRYVLLTVFYLLGIGIALHLSV